MTRNTIRFSCTTLALASCLLASAAPSEARKAGRLPITIHVPAEQPTIQAAINVSLNKDTILVANGVYTGAGNRNIDFQGKEVTVKSENGAAVTIVDCQNQGRGFLFTSGETSKAKLIGFTIENALAPDTLGGGGVRCVSASPVITRCIIRNNSASQGGGVYVSGGSPVIRSSWIVDNSATTIPQQIGGGIFCTAGQLEISTTTIANNEATGAGGGIYAIAGAVVNIRDSILWGNTVSGFSEQVHFSGATVDVDFTDIEHGISGLPGSGNLVYGAGNIDDDPAFVAELAQDYHLSDLSPCIEAGDPAYVPPGANAVDVDGEDRVFAAFVDMGGDEYSSCDPIFKQYFPAGVPAAIPDNLQAGLLSTVDVSDFGIATGPTGLFVDVSHPNPSELLLVLYPPGCGPGDSCGIIPCGLIDTCPFPAFFSLGNYFDGTQVNGTWTLQLIDRAAGNVGTLLNWRLDLDFSLCP
jgi:hypothetical protein